MLVSELLEFEHFSEKITIFSGLHFLKFFIKIFLFNRLKKDKNSTKDSKKNLVTLIQITSLSC